MIRMCKTKMIKMASQGRLPDDQLRRPYPRAVEAKCPMCGRYLVAERGWQQRTPRQLTLYHMVTACPEVECA